MVLTANEFVSWDRKVMDLPNLGLLSSVEVALSSSLDDSSKRVRKPYTITKSRESWTEPEHDKFLEALQLFDRDWKKIEVFIGSKTAIQIRSHAQKYFLKVQKNGTGEHLPPPRPKRKASRPSPLKASKAQTVSLESPSPSVQQPSPAVPEAVLNKKSDSSTTLRQTDGAAFLHERTDKSMPSTSCSQMARVLPDFTQVYSFIGNVFDPDVSGHLQKLKSMDQIDIETILLLMRNLSNNLSSPDFENHRRILSSYEFDSVDSAFIVTDSFLTTQSEAAG